MAKRCANCYYDEKDLKLERNFCFWWAVIATGMVFAVFVSKVLFGGTVATVESAPGKTYAQQAIEACTSKGGTPIIRYGYNTADPDIADCKFNPADYVR